MDSGSYQYTAEIYSPPYLFDGAPSLFRRFGHLMPKAVFARLAMIRAGSRRAGSRPSSGLHPARDRKRAEGTVNRIAALGALGLLTVGLLSGCGSGPAGLLAGPPARILVLSGSILGPVLAQNKDLTKGFAERLTYVTAPATSRQSVPQVAGTVVPTAIYTSFATFASDLAAGNVRKSARAIMYDPEKWAATPIGEQRNPRAYMIRFSKAARAHGFVPILAPARDLVLVPGASCVKHAGENLTQAYIRCGLATADTRAGALVVQSQADEFNVPVFRRFIAVAARQARRADPRVAVLAQLATAPLGQEASAEQLVSAAWSVSGLVQGFSLAARAKDIQTVEEFLRSLKES